MRLERCGNEVRDKSDAIGIFLLVHVKQCSMVKQKATPFGGQIVNELQLL